MPHTQVSRKHIGTNKKSRIHRIYSPISISVDYSILKSTWPTMYFLEIIEFVFTRLFESSKEFN